MASNRSQSRREEYHGVGFGEPLARTCLRPPFDFAQCPELVEGRLELPHRHPARFSSSNQFSTMLICEAGGPVLILLSVQGRRLDLVPAYRIHGIGIRYRLRWSVGRENA